jgi:restriction endonuclease S subunit
MLKNNILPDSWRWMELGSLISFIGSGITPRGGREVYKKNGIPFIRSQNVYPDGLRLEDVAYITPDLHRSMERTHVQTGDVLLNITGASIGRSTYVPEWLNDANVNQHVCILRPLEIINPIYLSTYLNSPLGQNQIMGAQSGVTRQGLNYSQVRAFRIAVPPISEQERIIAKIEVLFTQLDAGTAALRRVQAQLKRYKRSLLKSMCGGEYVERKLRRGNEILPETWQWSNISDVAESLDNLRIPINKEEREKRQGQYPYYGANGQVGWIDNYIFDESLVLVVEDETGSTAEKRGHWHHLWII